MAEVRMIKASLLLILVLQFTAVTEQSKVSSFTAREGDEVTLSCENLNNDQDKCGHTSWYFGGLSRSEDLVTSGKIVEKAKSDRLSFTENCSLVIKNVTGEDTGRYECQQNKPGQQHESKLFHLSVIKMQERDDGEQVTLSCSVSRHTRFTHTVKWLYEGDDADIIRYTNMQTSQSECSVTVTFPTSYFNQKSKYLQLSSVKCEMTDGYTQEVQQFPFSPPQSSDDTTTTTTITTTESSEKSRTISIVPAVSDATTPSAEYKKGHLEWWWFVIVAVGLVALLVIIVAVIRCKRTKGKKTRTDDNAGQSLNPAVTQPGPDTSQDTGDPEDGVSYASISYRKKTSNKALVQVKTDDDDEGDSVTYSTVKASSSSAAAAGPSAEPSDLYAAINKTKK